MRGSAEEMGKSDDNAKTLLLNRSSAILSGNGNAELSFTALGRSYREMVRARKAFGACFKPSSSGKSTILLTTYYCDELTHLHI